MLLAASVWSWAPRGSHLVQAATLLQRVADDPDASGLLPFIRALQAVVGGSRDRSLADDAGLDYTMAAEILVLIETLEEREG